MLEKIEKIKKFTQNHPKIFQQEYGINDVGIFLFKPMKIIKRALLFKISFPNITFSKDFTKIFLAPISSSYWSCFFFNIIIFLGLGFTQNSGYSKSIYRKKR
jgi:hypothetical protein